jgi:hypothetical protein
MLTLVFEHSEDASKHALERELVLSDPSDEPLVFGSRSGADHILFLPGLASFSFRPGSPVVTAFPDPGAAPDEVIDAYRGSVLPFAVQVVLGGQSLHASAVSTRNGRIVAFGGETQAGKTTIAVGLSRRGYGLWADDTVAFQVLANGITALRLPFEPNLRERSAAYFESAGETQALGGTRIPPEWARAPLGAYCVLERLESAPDTHSLERLSPRDGFLALLTQSYRFKPQSREEKRRMMDDFLEASHLPMFRLRYRAGFDALPAVIEELEETVLGNVAPAPS